MIFLCVCPVSLEAGLFFCVACEFDIIAEKESIMADEKDRGFSEAMKYSHLGITFVITFGIFLAGGYFLDNWLGTSPWLFAFSVFPGLGAGFYMLYKELIVQKNDESKKS